MSLLRKTLPEGDLSLVSNCLEACFDARQSVMREVNLHVKCV